MSEHLSETDLAEIERRCQQATQGPWEWTQDEANARLDRYAREDGKRKARIRDRYLYLLQGRPTCYCARDHALLPPEVQAEHDARALRMRDSYDHRVFSLQWWQIRGSTFQGIVDPDMEFIAHARADVPRLLAEVRRLRQSVDTLERMLDPEPPEELPALPEPD